MALSSSLEVSRLSYDPKCISFSTSVLPAFRKPWSLRSLDIDSLYRAFPPCFRSSQPSSQRQLTYVGLYFNSKAKCERGTRSKIMACSSLDTYDPLQRLTHRPPQSLGTLKIVVILVISRKGDCTQNF